MLALFTAKAFGQTTVYDTSSLPEYIHLGVPYADLSISKVAQRFTTSDTGSFTATGIRLQVWDSRAWTPIVTIQSNEDGLSGFDDGVGPDGTVLGSFTSDSGPVLNTSIRTDFTFSGLVTLQPDSVYWVVFETGDPFSQVVGFDTRNGNFGSRGTGAWLTSDDYSLWTYYAPPVSTWQQAAVGGIGSTPLNMSITVAPIPEPAALSLVLGGGALAFAGTCRRHRKA